MLPTPSTSHVPYDKVYEPAEDSFLLLDALSQPSDVAFLTQRFRSGPSPTILEVGTGSGVVLGFVVTNAKTLLGRSDVLGLGTDINGYACGATKRTVMESAKANSCCLTADDMSGKDGLRNSAGVLLAALNASLTTPFIQHSIDILIFNPPYVPSETTPSHQQFQLDASTSATSQPAFFHSSNLLALATDGGADGMEVTKKLLAQLPDVLDRRRGVAYVLLCAQNRPEEVKARVRAWDDGQGGWDVQTVRDSGKQGGWEKLQILRIARKTLE